MNKVIVLEGNIIERKRVLKKIKDSFMDDYETVVFDKKDSYDCVSHALTEISCFSGDKLFIMRGLPAVDAPTDAQARTKVLNYLKKLFPTIPAGNVLVMDNIGISGESFLKEVRKYGEVHKFQQKINKSDGNQIASSYFKNKKIVIDDAISQLLVDSLNFNGDEIDVDKLYLILKKFYQYVYGKNKIVKEDVYAICSSKEFIIWSLYNMLDDVSSSEDKNIGSIISFIYNHLDNAKYFEHEVVMILRAMIWRYGLLLLAKSEVNNKRSQQEISDNISNIIKLESHGRSYKIQMNPKTSKDASIPEYSKKMINSVMNSYYGRAPLACYTYGQLLLIYYTAIKTLLKIRSGCTGSEIRIAISIMISVVCGIITKQNTIDGILEHKKLIYGINR
jgi:DNA polymerase III delta subunit